jgi:F-type H+-transporting ATPase subunit a
MIVLFFGLLIFRYFLRYKRGVIRYLLVSYVEGFRELTTESFGGFIYKHFVFITAIFTFILLCNWIAILPFVEEPTKDINTTLAMALVAFFYKEYYTIKTVGFKGYIDHFTHPFILMLPLNLIGHFSKIISMAFRLFGNIFGGAVITQIYYRTLASGNAVPFLPSWLEESIKQTFALFSGLNFALLFFFVGFEGLIQAFVFAMLSMAYLSIAIQGEEGD